MWSIKPTQPVGRPRGQTTTRMGERESVPILAAWPSVQVEKTAFEAAVSRLGRARAQFVEHCPRHSSMRAASSNGKAQSSSFEGRTNPLLRCAVTLNGLQSTEDLEFPVGMEINMYACAAQVSRLCNDLPAPERHPPRRCRIWGGPCLIATKSHDAMLTPQDSSPQNPTAVTAADKACHQNNRGRAALIERR
jgi:hypothetical protein